MKPLKEDLLYAFLQLDEIINRPDFDPEAGRRLWFYSPNGICFVIYEILAEEGMVDRGSGHELDRAYQLMFNLYEQWPECARDNLGRLRRDYPIPTNLTAAPGEVVIVRKTCWRWRDDQLESRRRLVKFCISKLEEQLS